jgi:hypothetical protein
MNIWLIINGINIILLNVILNSIYLIKIMNNLKELYLTYPIEPLFNQLIKDLVILIDEKEYPNHIIYYNDDLIFDYDKENNVFWCNYYKYWLIFYENFKFNNYQIRDLTKDMIEKYLKFSEVIPIASAKIRVMINGCGYLAKK